MDRWQKLDTAAVATLATLNPNGSPHLVPVVFARIGERIVTAIDGKAKSGSPLRRLSNIRANPTVCLLAHRYDEDWSKLWWVRVDGRATIVEADPHALTALRDRYPQYQSVEIPGPIISIEALGIRSWSA